MHFILDDDDDDYSAVHSSGHQSSSVPHTHQPTYNFSRIATEGRDNEAEDNDASTSSSMVVNTSIDDDLQRPHQSSSDSIDEEDFDTDRNNSIDNSSHSRALTTTKVTISTTTKVNRKRCHAINFDIFSTHPNARLSNNNFLDDDRNSLNGDSLDCFRNKKIKYNTNNNQNNISIISEEARTPNANRQVNSTGNENDNYFNTPDSGISIPAGSSSAGCSSSSHQPNDNNCNTPDNDAIESVDRISITLFHENVSRVRRNYRKKFDEDSDSD